MPIAWTLEKIGLHLIDRPRRPSRLDLTPEALGALVDSIAAEGMYQPPGLAGPSGAGRYRTIWGDRRVHAARLLNWPTIEARVCPWDTDDALAKINENNVRDDLSPVEEAENVRELLDAGHAHASIMRMMRRGPDWLDARLAILRMPADLRDALHRKTIPIGVARALTDIDHAPYRADLVNEAERTGATLRTAEVWRAHYLADRDRIVQNNLAVQQIIERREAFVIKAVCDLCDGEAPYPETKPLRVCRRCAEIIADLKRELLAAHQAEADGDRR